MVKKYKMVRMEEVTYNAFKAKKVKMENSVKSWTGKNVHIPLTRVMKVIATNPTEIHEKNLIKAIKVRRVKV